MSEIFARLGVNICPALMNGLSHAADAGSGVFSLMDRLFRDGYACMQQLYHDSMITLYILHTRNSCRHRVIDDIDMKRKTVTMRDKATSSRK